MNEADTSEDPVIRKTFSMRQSMWDNIADYRFKHRITTEVEAIRRLLEAALLADKREK